MPAITRKRATESVDVGPRQEIEPTAGRKRSKVVAQEDKVKDEGGTGDNTRYFLMKAEPESRIEQGIDVKFSIDDLKATESEPWDGVRNAEASKTMRERMKVGDKAFFYHSNTKNPGIAGIMTICKQGYPDDSAWNSKHPYFDPKTNKNKPKWYRVDVKYDRHMSRFLSLKELKSGNFPELQDMQLLKRPQLSVQQVKPIEWETILKIEKMDSATEGLATKRPSDQVSTKVELEDVGSISADKARDDAIKLEIAASHGAADF